MRHRPIPENQSLTSLSQAVGWKFNLQPPKKTQALKASSPQKLIAGRIDSVSSREIKCKGSSTKPHLPFLAPRQSDFLSMTLSTLVGFWNQLRRRRGSSQPGLDESSRHQPASAAIKQAPRFSPVAIVRMTDLGIGGCFAFFANGWNQRKPEGIWFPRGISDTIQLL